MPTVFTKTIKTGSFAWLGKGCNFIDSLHTIYTKYFPQKQFCQFVWSLKHKLIFIGCGYKEQKILTLNWLVDLIWILVLLFPFKFTFLSIISVTKNRSFQIAIMTFSIFTEWCNHRHNLLSEHFHHPQKKPCAHSQSLSTPTPILGKQGSTLCPCES